MDEIDPSNKNPSKRLVVSDEAVAFVSRGGNIFAGQVIDADPEIKPGEEVMVTDRNNRLLTVARAFLTPEEMEQIRRNMAVPAYGAA